MQETWVWSLGWKDPLEEGMATHFQYSCLENPTDRGAWWAIVHGVTKSQTRLNELSTAQHSKSLRIFGSWTLCPFSKLPSRVSLTISLVTPLSLVLPERNHNSRDSIRLSGIFQGHLPIFFTSVTSAKSFRHVKFWEPRCTHLWGLLFCLHHMALS